VRLAATAVACAIAAATVAYARPIALGSIHLYQRAGAPIASRIGLRCRFTPTCSRYAEVMITRQGVMRGGWKALKRIASCNPWTPPGTRDDP
jgi:uncharacterized protein